MLLSDTAILHALGLRKPPIDLRPFPAGENYQGLAITPWYPAHLNPASVDLTLSPVIRWMPRPMGSLDYGLDLGALPEGHTRRWDTREGSFIDQWEGIDLQPETIRLGPGQFLLGATAEVVTLPDNLAARVEGKSSLGRLGLAVHITAGFIDPGFQGSITLEIANLSPRPIILRPNMRIAQIAFTPMVEPVQMSYGRVGHYQDQPAGEPVESRYGR